MPGLMAAARSGRKATRSEGAVVKQNHRRGEEDAHVAPDGPPVDVFEVGLQQRGEVVLMIGRTAEAADLGETGQPRTQRMPLPIALVDFPEELRSGQRAGR